MDTGVSCVRVFMWIVGFSDSFPPFMERMKIVSWIMVRCIDVIIGEVKTVIGVSTVSGKSPVRPSQKERLHSVMLSLGIVVRGDREVSSSNFPVCESSNSITHGLVSVRLSFSCYQSKSLPTPLNTRGSCPTGLSETDRVGVGINGLCGMLS